MACHGVADRFDVCMEGTRANRVTEATAVRAGSFTQVVPLLLDAACRTTEGSGCAIGSIAGCSLWRPEE